MKQSNLLRKTETRRTTQPGATEKEHKEGPVPPTWGARGLVPSPLPGGAPHHRGPTPVTGLKKKSERADLIAYLKEATA